MDNQKNNEICIVTKPEELIVADPVVLETEGMTGEQIVECARMTGEYLQSTLAVTDEMQVVSELLPESSHGSREELILSAKDMDTQQKLEAMYKNDEFEISRREKMNSVANRNRDNRTKNSVLQFLGYSSPLVILLTVPASRKVIVNGLKRLFRVA